MVINTSRWRGVAFILGAIDGLLYTGSSMLYERLYGYVELFLRQDVESHEFNILTSTLRDPIWYWYGILGWNVMLFGIASYLVHRWWAHVKSVFWIWQMIGIAAVTGFYVLRLCITLLDSLLTGRNDMYEFISVSEGRFIPISIAIAILINLIFAGLIRFSLNQCMRQKIHPPIEPQNPIQRCT